MEASNVQKMREALLFVKQYFDKIDPFNPNTYTFAQIEVDHIQDAISAALVAPPRNCDLRYYNNATIDECSARAYVDYLQFCEKYGACCKCPMNSENGSCLAKYLLSPAEEGGE